MTVDDPKADIGRLPLKDFQSARPDPLHCLCKEIMWTHHEHPIRSPDAPFYSGARKEQRQ